MHFLYRTRQWKRKQTHRKCERNKLTCWLITGELWGLVWIFRWLWHSHHIKHKSIRSMRTGLLVMSYLCLHASVEMIRQLKPQLEGSCWPGTPGHKEKTHTRTQVGYFLQKVSVICQHDCSCLKLQVHESQSHSKSQKGLMFMHPAHHSLLYPTRIYWIGCQIRYDKYCTGWKSPREIRIRSAH